MVNNAGIVAGDLLEAPADSGAHASDTRLAQAVRVGGTPPQPLGLCRRVLSGSRRSTRTNLPVCFGKLAAAIQFGLEALELYRERLFDEARHRVLMRPAIQDRSGILDPHQEIGRDCHSRSFHRPPTPRRRRDGCRFANRRAILRSLGTPGRSVPVWPCISAPLARLAILVSRRRRSCAKEAATYHVGSVLRHQRAPSVAASPSRDGDNSPQRSTSSPATAR